MQKFLSGLIFLFAAVNLPAQSVDDIKDLIAKGQWDKAKTAVDGFLAKEKNAAKWEGWWYKGVIYNEIAKSEQYKNLVTDGRMDAFNAFKKYYEIDTKSIQGVLEQHVRLFDIYNGYFDMAAVQYNNEKKYGEAFENFKKAHIVEEYIASKGYEINGFKFPEFDTVLIRNIALSAYMAQKEDDALSYYKRITDKKITGNDNTLAYEFMVEHYNKKKDMANREKYLQLGRELYPDNDYWHQTELADVDDKDKKALLAKYNELTSKYPTKKVLFYNYGVELFNYTISDPKPADYKETQAKFETIMKKALELNKGNAEANVIMAMHYYNISFDIQDEQKAIKGNTPADQKKKADLKAQLVAKQDELIPYALAACDIYGAKATLKPIDKANYRKVTDFLVSAYEIKGMKDKAEEYKKKLDAIQ